MREKLILLLFGSLVGIGSGVAVSQLFDFGSSLPEGSSFNSLSDLRAAISQRDSRDNKDGKSVSLRTLIQPNESDLIIYELRPHLEVKFQKENVKINSHGMRGPEVQMEKQEGTYRIALLGDSFAFGWGVPEEDCFARVLERKLQAELPKDGPIKKVEVLNFGVPGYSTFQQVAKFETHGIKFDPDAILIYFIQNDFGLPFFINRFDGSDKLATAGDFEKFRRSKDADISTPAKKWVNSIDANYSLKRLTKFAKERGISTHITINPRPGWEKDREKLWALKNTPDLNHIELRQPYLEYLDANPQIDRHKDLSLAHDPHPSSLKHFILGELLSHSLKELVS